MTGNEQSTMVDGRWKEQTPLDCKGECAYKRFYETDNKRGNTVDAHLQGGAVDTVHAAVKRTENAVDKLCVCAGDSGGRPSPEGQLTVCAHKRRQYDCNNAKAGVVRALQSSKTSF